eukprot:c10747_g2_i1.p1 GENE.c10747_g2_i1~~c10747_g2_i1.p1  ORF type:complete len:361 (-),score=106.74 c10747_g2_i1:193-1173(-)
MSKRTYEDSNSNSDIVTTAEMHDVWVNEIGPKLDAHDILQIALVSKWGRNISHSLVKHSGHAKVKQGLDASRQATLLWPHLKLALTFASWNQRNDPPAMTFKPTFLKLWQCDIADFEFVSSARLEELYVHDPPTKFPEPTRSSLEGMLLSAHPNAMVSLTLSWCLDPEDDVQWLVRALRHLRNLTHLNLRSNHLGADKIQLIAPALASMTKMTTVMIGYNYFGPEGMDHLAPALRNMSQLTWLNIEANDLGVEGTKQLVPALCNMPLLIKLFLWENWMRPEGLKHLLPVLPQLKHLKCLHLWDNDLTEELVEHVKQLMGHLEELDI